MEKNMIHAENIISYINILTDYQQTQKSHTSSILHTNGNISFHDVTLQYEDLTNVFPMGLNFNIGIGTKIGICGRTGSGKSSIAKLLFQIVSCSHGSITIGDINIERFDSSYLSSIMYLITQDSIIFSQSLRFNLDPMGQVLVVDL
uniref:Canalicular multispecific organic anion transporter 1 (Trinotate prediction) n=1 Tax=Henneguya salminicola TaxID=69463 RepID=A0A6G3MLK4_HENSL